MHYARFFMSTTARTPSLIRKRPAPPPSISCTACHKKNRKTGDKNITGKNCLAAIPAQGAQEGTTQNHAAKARAI